MIHSFHAMLSVEPPVTVTQRLRKLVTGLFLKLQTNVRIFRSSFSRILPAFEAIYDSTVLVISTKIFILSCFPAQLFKWEQE